MNYNEQNFSSVFCVRFFGENQNMSFRVLGVNKSLAGLLD